ncbi:GumC family protein [Hymenobacter sp. HD11105]
MSARDFLRRLRRHWLLLLLIPLTTAGSIYVFTRFQAKKYTSDTVIYTGIASGYKIEGGNNDSGGGWNATATAFDNLLTLINSRDTRQEVCLRLLAWRLMTDAGAGGKALASEPQAGVLHKLISRLQGKKPADKESPYQRLLSPQLKQRLTGPTQAETTRRVLAFYQTTPANPLYRLIHSKDPEFSEEALWRIDATRVKDSDLVRIEYSAADPTVCQKTLELLTQVFIRKHRELFTGQNESVVGYFDQATQKAYQRLQAAEQRLLAFHQQHNIVDYDKQIVASTEDRQLSLDKYNDLQMQYAGAVSSLKSVENSLSKRGVSNLKSQEIIRLRNRLSDLNGQIAEVELLHQAQPSPAASARLASLKQEAAQLSDKIGETVNSYYSSTQATQGVTAKDLVADYSKNTLLVADLRSQLGLMRQQKEASASHYNQLVPLGAEIRKLRREVEVAEKEYLSQMEGTKQSKLSQQNGVLASQLRVIDPPYFPLDANSSKTLLLMVGGFLGAFLLLSGGLATAGLLDNSLQQPTVASRTTKFPVAGILAKTDNLTEPQRLNAQRAADHLGRQLLLKFQQQARPDKPYVIGVLSSQSGEGKTAVCASLAASLRAMRLKTLTLFPDTHYQLPADQNGSRFYSPLLGLAPGATVADFTGKATTPDTVVIIEFPALLESAYPASLLQDLDLILVAVRADRAWHQADRTIFDNIKRIARSPIELVLNGVLPDYVTDFIGKQARPLGAYPHPALPAHPEQALLHASS